MKSFHKILNVLLICGLVGMMVTSFVSNRVISLLFTPPVSFGTNCEPAAAWSMSKLAATQTIGFIAGVIGGFFALKAFDKKKELPAQDVSPS